MSRITTTSSPVRTAVPRGSVGEGFAGDPVVPGHDVVMALRLVRTAGVVGGETRIPWLFLGPSAGVFSPLSAAARWGSVRLIPTQPCGKASVLKAASRFALTDPPRSPAS